MKTRRSAIFGLRARLLHLRYRLKAQVSLEAVVVLAAFACFILALASLEESAGGRLASASTVLVAKTDAVRVGALLDLFVSNRHAAWKQKAANCSVAAVVECRLGGSTAGSGWLGVLNDARWKQPV